MILRPLQVPVALLFLLPSLIAAQDNPFDCQNRLSIQSLNFDLSKLAGEHSILRTRDTPPSTVVDEVRFNVCSDLVVLEGVSEHDQVRVMDMMAVFSTLNRKAPVSQGDESLSDADK